MGDGLKEIDLASWPRRNHFEFFRSFERPHFDVACRVEVTEVVRHCRQTDRSLFGTLFHGAMWAANEVDAFRLRFVDDRVFEVATCHGSFTFLGPGDLFNYATARYHDDLDTFIGHIKTARDEAYHRTDVNLDDDHELELVYITSMPWLDIQAVSHPFTGEANDCVPRVAWGKVVDRVGGGHEMTLQVTGHHALMDGVHVARYVDAFRHYCEELP